MIEQKKKIRSLCINRYHQKYVNKSYIPFPLYQNNLPTVIENKVATRLAIMLGE